MIFKIEKRCQQKKLGKIQKRHSLSYVFLKIQKKDLKKGLF
jgi:hypothetical protein